jgi:hypothetical protein
MGISPVDVDRVFYGDRFGIPVWPDGAVNVHDERGLRRWQHLHHR